MALPSFDLERFFARHEFSARYLLCSSDCDGLGLNWLLARSDEQTGRMWRDLKLGYTESRGLPLLREQISMLYHGPNPEEILVAAPEEGIFVALNAILSPGDHIVCMFPGYQSLYTVAQSLGCQVTFWRPDEPSGWKFDPDFLKRALRTDTKLLVINSPHNPTGAMLTRAEYQGVLELAERRGIYVFSDEMYRLLEYDPALRLPPACELYERAVTLFGMSKTFGLAGLRIGWVVTRDRPLLERMSEIKDYTTICSSAPSELLAVIALRNAGEIVAMHMARIQRNLSRLDDFFARWRTRFNWVRPRAGTIAFPRLEGTSNSLDFCEQLVARSGVLLLPSTVYDYGSRHFRLGFGRENMPEALAVLDRYLVESDQSLCDST